MLFSICAIISFGLSDNAFIAVPQSQQGRGASRGSRVAEPAVSRSLQGRGASGGSRVAEPAGAAGARSQQCREACRVAEPRGQQGQQGRGATGAVGARSHGGNRGSYNYDIFLLPNIKSIK